MVEPHLRIYKDRSELIVENGRSITYIEGKPNEESKKRNKKIKEVLDKGWFRNLVIETRVSLCDGIELEEYHRELLTNLINAVTSEVGRALIGLSVLQLTIRAILPEQSIRLHKGGHADFSWADGITMRTLDSNYIEPVLREFGLLYVNKYGVFMTRSLAENYPYTQFYKAAVRGGKEYWLNLTDEIESDKVNSLIALKYIISLLSNRSEEFIKLADEAIQLEKKFLHDVKSTDEIFKFIQHHVNSSSYSARLFEIALHSFIQAVQESGELDGYLLPLCQMRTANKKHRNIGDIEITISKNNNRVIESWDAKYGKPYLRDELEELDDKLISYGSVQIVGYVTDGDPQISKDISDRIKEIEEMNETSIKILTFKEWVDFWCERIDKKEDINFVQTWLDLYVQSLCQRRRDFAPIDEPSEQWVIDLIKLFKSYQGTVGFRTISQQTLLERVG